MPEEPAKTARRTLSDFSDVELAKEKDRAAHTAFIRAQQPEGARARKRIASVQAEQDRRADLARRSVPAHPLDPAAYQAAQDHALNARFAQQEMARQNEQVDKHNATIDSAEHTAANAPEKIDHAPEGAEVVGGGRLLLVGGNGNSWSLRSADNKHLVGADDFATSKGGKARLSRTKINDLADHMADVRDSNGNRVPFTAPDAKDWAPGFRDQQGHNLAGASALTARDWAGRNGVAIHKNSRFARTVTPTGGRLDRTDKPGADGFYPRQSLSNARPGDEVTTPEGHVKTVVRTSRTEHTHDSRGNYIQPSHRTSTTTLHFGDGTTHSEQRTDYGARGTIPIRYAGGVSPMDASRTADPGMGFTSASNIGSLPGSIDTPSAKKFDQEADAALRNTPGPGTRFVESADQGADYKDQRPKVGTITDRISHVQGTPARVVEYDDGTFDAVTAHGLAKINANPSEDEVNEARGAWGLPRTGSDRAAARAAADTEAARPDRAEPRRVEPADVPAPRGSNAPEMGAPAETHANALARMNDAQARAHIATLPHSTLTGIDQVMAHRAAALGKPDVVTTKHQMVRDAIPAAPHTAIIDGPAQDEIAQARSEVLGLHELPDGHLEVEPEVGARQDRVSKLLTDHEAGALNLKAASTEDLHQHHRDLSNELRLQQEIARRDAVHPPRRVSAATTQAGTPRVRPGLAGAAQDHAEALRSEDAAAINRTRARLESALRRSRANSDTAHTLAQHVDTGAANAHTLDALAGSLRAESRQRRNDASRKRAAAKRLDRERISSVLGSVNAELRSRGESPEVAKELGAPRTAHAPEPPLMSEGPVLREVVGGPAAPKRAADAVTAKVDTTASPFPEADRLPDEPFATGYTVSKSTPRLKGSQIQPGVRVGLRGSAPMWMTVAKKESAGPNLVKLTGTNGHERIITPNGYEQVHSAQVHHTEKGWELLPHVATSSATRAQPVKPLTDAEYAEHTQRVEQGIDAALKAGKATNITHTLQGTGRNAIYTPERAQQHKEIVDELWAKHGENAPREGKAILAGGLMGAGKSTVLGEHAGIGKGEYLTINPDEIKDAMATRGMVPEVKGLSPLEASTLIHDESSHISNLLAQRAYGRKTNVIWDVSMSNKDSMRRRMNEMAGHGYSKPDGVFVDVPVETSVQRALSRHREGMEAYRQGNGLGGRYAPPHLIRKSASPTSSSTNRDVFNELAGEKAFGSSVVFDNSTLGQAPTKVVGTGRWADSTNRAKSATLEPVEKTKLAPNPAWKQPRDAVATLTDEQRTDLRDLSYSARGTYAKQRAAGHEHADALTLARGQSLTDGTVPRSRVSLPDSLERQAVATTHNGAVPSTMGGELSRAVDEARQKLARAKKTQVAYEPVNGPTHQAAVAGAQRRVTALEGLANLHNVHGGTANLTDNPKLMSPARLRAQIIALEGSTNPADLRRLKTLRKAADDRNIGAV